MAERNFGREFSNESVGYTQSVLNEIDKQLETAGEAGKAVLESEREFVKNNLPDFLSSFESIRDEFSGWPNFNQAVEHKDVEGLKKIFLEKVQVFFKPGDYISTYANTLVKGIERFGKYNKVWEFLNK